MRKKEIKLVVTFPTIADAFALEKECKNNEILGRLIPAPRIFSSGCGLAWCCDFKNKEIIQEILINNNIEYDGIHEYEM